LYVALNFVDEAILKSWGTEFQVRERLL